MTPNIREVRVNPEMQFTTDDLCRMLFGKGVHAFAEEVRNDTTGKYEFLREDDGEKNDPPTIEIRSGYKYARCMQCGKWWNVCMQFTGWYVCPKCRCRKENEHGRKEETH